ncbi:hypothetical protein WN944_014538 [Citrus x changshan-huyou]|uniref:Uncharacterized protein n=1 Tax=Citrus x changshan-huyou TaxID=2935761 RepID=A0AAP0M8J7_9ROSI
MELLSTAVTTIISPPFGHLLNDSHHATALAIIVGLTPLFCHLLIGNSTITATSAILEAKYTSGTTSLNRHVESSFSKNQLKIEEALQGRLKVLERKDGTCEIGYGSFDPNVLQSLIARMVVMHELPLRFVEYKGFREMIAHTNPVVKPMSRNTLKNDILKLYHIEKRDPQYKSLPSDSEWDLAATMVEHLRSFYMLMEMFSGTKYPIANLFFPSICKMKMSINGWRTSDNPAIRIMAENFKKCWNEIHPMLVVAVVLDPRYKMLLIDFYFPKIYGDTSNEHIEHARKLCHDLVKEYEMKAMVLSDGQDVGLENVPSESSSNPNKYWDVDEFETFRSRNKRVKLFGRLTSKYPILGELAKDILAIPVSIVASKSAFSTGGRFLSGVLEDEILAGEEVISDDDNGAQLSSCLT